MPKLYVEKIHEDAKLPEKPTIKTDSGFDVFAYNVKQIYYHGGGNGEQCLKTDEHMQRKFPEPGVLELQCNERALIGTGLKLTVGEGYEIQVRPRSGLALKHGITVLNTPGTIDSDYRGEVGIILINHGKVAFTIEPKMRIAQFILAPVVRAVFRDGNELTSTARGEGGFGHTGTH